MEEGRPRLGLSEKPAESLPVASSPPSEASASPDVASSPSGGMFGAGTPTFLTTRLDFVVNWARRNSLWPMPFGTACCAIEMMAAAGQQLRSGALRDGAHVVQPPPGRRPDLRGDGCPTSSRPSCAASGTRCPSRSGPSRWVPALLPGACSTCTRWCRGSIPSFPVDVYVPGCPPRPEGLIYGLMMIQEKIRQERLSEHGALRAEDPAEVARARADADEVLALSGPFGNSTRQNRVSRFPDRIRRLRPARRPDSVTRTRPRTACRLPPPLKLCAPHSPTPSCAT